MNIKATSIARAEWFFNGRGVSSVRCNKERGEIAITVARYLTFNIPPIIL